DCCGSASSSASRRRASAIPSSSSDKIPGRDSRSFAARDALSCSDKSNANFCISEIVAILEEYSRGTKGINKLLLTQWLILYCLLFSTLQSSTQNQEIPFDPVEDRNSG